MLNEALDTRATGVFVIHIKHAEGLSAQDRNGRSDPYIVLAYAKAGAIQIVRAPSLTITKSSENHYILLASSWEISTLYLTRRRSCWCHKTK